LSTFTFEKIFRLFNDTESDLSIVVVTNGFGIFPHLHPHNQGMEGEVIGLIHTAVHSLYTVDAVILFDWQEEISFSPHIF
jgi:hypothetical protein